MQNVHHCSHKQVCEHRVIIYSICCLCCIFSHSVVHYQHTQVIHNMAAFSEMTMGQWVTGQVGQRIRVGHVGHGSVLVTR